MKSWVLAGMTAAGLMAAAGGAWANNLVVTNVTVKGLNNTTACVQFDIAWSNSWRYTNINHDAAWVFFKVQKEGDVSNDWQHVTLEGDGVNPPGCSTGTGTGIELVVPPDRVGLFVRRAAEGTGLTSVQDVKAVWNFASNSLTKTDNVRVQALAVEMVYVAEGTNTVGDGTTGTVRGQFEARTNGTPFAITNEAYAITLGGGGVGSMGNHNASGMTTVDDFKDGTSKILPAAFPKGYNAFYCMKYETTQGQYRDFLNMLTRAQQVTRTGSRMSANFALSATNAIAYRNGIRCPLVIPDAPTSIVFGCDANVNMLFNQVNDAMDRVCNYLSWADGCAFADWAGLRPMTELEFEKACRGPLTPVKDEYAWGTTTISATGSIANDGTGTDTANTGNCNYDACTPDGPYRAGIYAKASSSRQSAGASYWGIMDLSGSVWERVVTVGTNTGRAFTGLHGNGTLDATGNADVTAWPNTTASGTGDRGGAWLYANTYARASDRERVSYVASWRDQFRGWRGVRTAPSGVGP